MRSFHIEVKVWNIYKLIQSLYNLLINNTVYLGTQLSIPNWGLAVKYSKSFQQKLMWLLKFTLCFPNLSKLFFMNGKTVRGGKVKIRGKMQVIAQ